MPRRSRSRSRSPRRDRVRDRSRERDRDTRRDRDYDRRGDFERPERRERGERREERRDDRREVGRERYGRRSRSPEEKVVVASNSGGAKPKNKGLVEKKRFTAEDFAGKTEDEIEMMKLMGFGGFDTTKGKKVEGNDVGAVHVKLKRNYRQYMNRRGGFNRPLDAVH